MTRTLRILQVSDLYEPFIGGGEQHVKILSQGLAKRGHSVTVATSHLPGTVAEETVGGVRIKRITGWSTRVLARWYERPDAPFHPPLPDPGFVAALNAIIDDLRPDIVHAHSWIAYSCMAAKLRGALLIVTLHDHGTICSRKTLWRDDKELCAGPRMDRCVRCTPGQYGVIKGTALTSGLRMARSLHSRVDSWIATSNFVADSTSRLLPQRAVTDVIPAAIEPPSSTPMHRPSWLPSDDYLLFVGALGRHKGLHWLLEGHAGSGLSPLVVIGTPRSDTPSTWPNDVIVHTNVPHQDVMAAWRYARLGIVPSLWPEPFGLVAIEAMYSGIPVVASRIGGLAEVVTDDVGILVTPGNTPELRAALLRLEQSPELCSAMGTAGRARAALYSPAKFVESNEAHYYRLLDGHPSRPLNPARHIEKSIR
jgi:glycosyltransferase involved in cell wall biosynthesis